MCIKLIRWFLCPVPTTETTQSEETPGSPVADAPEKPWLFWKYGQTASLQELTDYGATTPYQGFTYVWHNEVSWIRCAIIKGRLCQLAPTETRTEVYSNISCSDCVGEDSSIRKSRPLEQDCQGHAEATGDDLIKLEAAVAEYFDELLKLLQAWLDRQRNRTLSSASHEVLFGSLCCVERPDRHINLPEDTMNHPMGAHPFECFKDCICTKQPWAQNISRAARWEEACDVRMQEPASWFLHSHAMAQAGILDDVRYSMGDLSPLAELFVGINHSVDMNELIDEQVRMFESWAPSELDSGPEEMSPEEWVEALAKQAWLAKQLAYYPSRDPGLSGKFCELLISNHILTVLNPWDYEKDAPDGGRVAYMGRPAQQNVCQMVREWSTHDRELSPDDRKLSEKAFENATVRREKQFQTMERNVPIARRNMLALYDGVERRILAREITPAVALESSEACPVCQDEWQEFPETPRQYRIASTHCCKKPLHIKCFKRWVCCRKTAPCPYCNEDLSKIARLVRPTEYKYEPVPFGIFFLPKDGIEEIITAGHNDSNDVFEELVPTSTITNQDGTTEQPWFLNRGLYFRVLHQMLQSFWGEVSVQVLRDDLNEFTLAMIGPADDDAELAQGGDDNLPAQDESGD